MSGVERPNAAYRFYSFVFRCFFRLYHRMRVEGVENIPAEGGCLVACNHSSYLDPPAIACMVRHRVFRFVARDTLWKGRMGKWFLQQMNAIPITRDSGDLGAMRAVLKAVKNGDVVALFPEGTRSPDGIPREAKPGVGFLVARAGAPIVPVAILGSHAAFKKGGGIIRPVRITVRYGTPILPEQLPTIADPKPSYAAISEFIMSRIGELAAAPAR